MPRVMKVSKRTIAERKAMYLSILTRTAVAFAARVESSEFRDADNIVQEAVDRGTALAKELRARDLI